jgi:hypothetical protein
MPQSPEQSESLLPEQRSRGDRRQRPTPVLRAFGVPSRRSAFRRAGEGINSYVDQLAWAMVGWGGLLMLLSGVDAYLTLIHLQYGGQEVVPTMAWALERGVHTFVVLKLAITGLGAVYLVAHQNFRVAKVSIFCLINVYVLLMAYHGILAWKYW